MTIESQAYSFAAVHYIPTDEDRPLDTRIVVRPIDNGLQIERIMRDEDVQELLREERRSFRPARNVAVALGRFTAEPTRDSAQNLTPGELPYSGFLESDELAKSHDGKEFRSGPIAELPLPPLKYGEMQQVLVRIPIEDVESVYGVEVIHLWRQQRIGGLYIVFSPDPS